MDYKIVEEEYGLERTVRELISEGWVPIGGVSISIAHVGFSSSVYAQAMIRIKSKPKAKKVKFDLCGECGERAMPTTYPNEGSSEPVCWECLARANWSEVKKLRKETKS